MNSTIPLIRLNAVQQPVVRHEADYEMSEHDKALVSQGKALYYLGESIAKIKLLFKTFRTTEYMVYLLALMDNPHLIVDILIPREQFANSAAVHATGETVLRANREARAKNCIIRARRIRTP